MSSYPPVHIIHYLVRRGLWPNDLWLDPQLMELVSLISFAPSSGLYLSTSHVFLLSFSFYQGVVIFQKPDFRQIDLFDQFLQSVRDHDCLNRHLRRLLAEQEDYNSLPQHPGLATLVSITSISDLTFDIHYCYGLLFLFLHSRFRWTLWIA